MILAVTAALAGALSAAAPAAERFPPAYQPIYRAAIPWYAEFGSKIAGPVDPWMVPPDRYAAELAEALGKGRNFIAEHPHASWPLLFVARVGGRRVKANYWLTLPDGFGKPGQRFPLIIGLHGSGWLAHPISFVDGARSSHPARTFSVAPIDEAGPWQIDFLNAYLDELLRLLPVDADRVYVEGHSLGGMATWEWAIQNPERFAAISPRAGIGEPYLAARLKHVPAWVIHGADDDVVPRAFADQMVCGLEAVGAPVRYTVLPGVTHNMPPDLDEEQVIDWYLRQKRSAVPPAVAEETIGPTMAVTAGAYFQTQPFNLADERSLTRAQLELGRKIHASGERVDEPFEEIHLAGQSSGILRVRAPATLRKNAVPPAGAILVPAQAYRQFRHRGNLAAGLQRAADLAGGGPVIVIARSLWRDSETFIADYRVPVRPAE